MAALLDATAPSPRAAHLVAQLPPVSLRLMLSPVVQQHVVWLMLSPAVQQHVVWLMLSPAVQQHVVGVHRVLLSAFPLRL